jgi:uncharacterized protein YabE (DUF348 family)
MEKLKKRSSIYSKKSVSKRRKARKRAGLIITLVLIAAGVTLGSLVKTITVSADGKQYKIVTLSSTYAKALEAKNITVGPEDKAVPSLDSKITNGSTIKIIRAANVKVNVDGKLLSIRSAEGNVADMLKAQGIALSEYDKVSPSKDAQLKEGLEITVTRVTTKDAAATSPVAFTTATKNDSTLLKGTTKVLQSGVNGEKTTVTRIFYENGKEVSRAVISETITKQPVQKIVATGTKTVAAASTSDSRGSSLSYSKVLTVKATAYSEEEASNSWGLQTAMGVDAVRDPNGWSTIAVDPSVIPLGTKVYVEGYGYAIAQDTGSAIIGMHIDCFFYTVAEMNAWGTRTVNVYILN